MNVALRSYGLLIRWEYLRLRSQLIMLLLVQVLVGVGVVYGMSFLLPDMTSSAALYLATGAPTLSLLILGITVVSQEVARAKDTGREEYQRALPLPALALLAAIISFWLLVNLPGTALSLWVATLRFDIGLDIGALAGPVIVLVALTAASLGYALAQSMSPAATQQLSSFISLGILLFSPISFPPDRLPTVLAAVHQVLPIQYMADLVRWSLTGRSIFEPATSFAIVGAWCALGLAVSYRVATKRR